MAAQADLSAAKDKLKKLIGKDIAAAYKLTDKSARSNALNEARAKAKAAFADAAPQDQMAANKLVKKLEAEIVRGAILKDGQPHRRPQHHADPPDRGDGRLPAAHPRFGAVHPRRDPGDLHHHARHQGRRADDRRARRACSYEHFMLHYNFPPYSVGEVGRFGAPGPPRSRPRQARLARAAPGAADQGGVPLHDPRPLRHHRVQRLVVDGDGLRRLRCR